MTRQEFDQTMARRARRLIAAGEMPSESEFWRAVYEVRRELAPTIRRARREAREQAQQQRKLLEVN